MSITRLCANCGDPCPPAAIRREYGVSDAERVWRSEVGIEWMTRGEGREAIPPEYTEYIGRALLDLLRRAA